LLASRRATLHDFMALSYGPARGLAYDRRRGFRAWVGCADRHGRNFCLVRCNAHKHVQALPTMPRHGVNTVDAPLQERVKSGKKLNRVYLRDRKPPQSGYSTESGHIFGATKLNCGIVPLPQEFRKPVRTREFNVESNGIFFFSPRASMLLSYGRRRAC